MAALDRKTVCTPGGETSPRGEYARRLEEARAIAVRLAGLDDLLGNLRLGVFGLGMLLGWLAWRGTLHPASPGVALVGLFVLVFFHGRIIVARRRAEGRAAYHERGLARLDDRWSGSGTPGGRFLDEEHPYAADLDLFGVGSLFERLCSARTASGEATLASWLLNPAPPGEVATRHDAVTELLPRIDFREDLALLGDDVRSSVSPDALTSWGRDSHRGASVATRWLIAIIAVSTVGALVGRLIGSLGTAPLLALLLLEAAIASLFARRASRALVDIEARSGELETLAGLLARIEREPFTSPRLLELRAGLEGGGRPASARIARLAGLVRWLEARHNVYFALFGTILLWKTQFALAVESWREEHGGSVGRWLDIVGEIEALVSLASYTFENPSDPFPELVDGGPIYEATGLGHPLLPSSRCVRNDIRLGGELRVLSVSGSNMSGKSTWLRTVGINAVLAQAGAPVRAARLRLSPLSIGGTLRVHDSLQAGRSRFYAEILRLKKLVEMAGQSPPLLFLIDEILHGTNSHDRLQGAEAIVRSLIDRGAIGLFTTHDLALAEVAGRLAPRAENVHFADHLDEKGRLAFDYKMQPGVVHQSNALALMRAVGLDI